MNLPVYFIADVHLQTTPSLEEERKIKLLLDFFQRVRQHRATLFIVGDLFDFWFEYESVIFACYFKVLRALQELVEAGCEIHYIGGNHDYWAGKFLTDTIGIRVHYTPLDIVINQQQFHITHGDGILRNDRGYRIMRAVLRSPLTINLFRHVHPDLALAIARKVSGKSRRLNRRLPVVQARDRADLLAYGQKQWHKGASYVVVGHLHLPTQVQSEGKVIINLGDWMYYFTFAYYDGNDLRLAYWQPSP